MSATVLKDGTILSFDDNTSSVKVLPKASLLIVDDRIAAIEADFNALNAPSNAEVVDVSGKIVSPGFINTHFHSWQSVCRSIGPDTNLIEYFGWVCGITPLVPTNFTPDDIYISSLQGLLEGLNGGVTTFIDHAHHNWSPDAIRPGYEGAVDSGARVHWCYDVNSRNPNSPPEKQWAELEAIAEDLPKRKSTVTLGLGLDGGAGLPHGQDLLPLAKEKIEKLDIKTITVHCLGGPWPTGGASPSELEQRKIHTLDRPLVVSHAGFLSKEDQAAVRAHNMNISITPESEFHYGHGQTTGHLIADHASLGIDTNWTFSGDIITQARLWLQSTRNHLYSGPHSRGQMPSNNPVSVEQAFLLATRQGGIALRRPDLGVLKVGAQADIAVFNSNSPNMLGWSNPLAAVILHANVGDIEHVLVAGQFRKRDFRLVNLKRSEAEVRQRFVAATQRLHPLIKDPPPMWDNLWGHTNIGPAEKVVMG